MPQDIIARQMAGLQRALLVRASDRDTAWSHFVCLQTRSLHQRAWQEKVSYGTTKEIMQILAQCLAAMREYSGGGSRVAAVYARSIARRIEYIAVRYRDGIPSPFPPEYLPVDSPDPLPPSVAIVPVGEQLRALLRRSPEEMRNLSPEKFEQLIAELLDRMGLNVTLTGNVNSKDGGVDIIAVPKACAVPFNLATQVKHHTDGQKVGRADVDRLLSLKTRAFDAGMLVTNTHFTRDALWLAEQAAAKPFLRLRDFNDLKRWLEDNFFAEMEWREMPSEIELAPGVTISIPKPDIITPGRPIF